jgi:putative sigma-54 modulation protein
MQLDISGHHVTVTPAMRNHVEERVSKIGHHFDTITDVHCILTVEGDRHKAEATVIAKGKKFFAESTEDNMYVAIDKLTHKLNRMIRQHKEKLHNYHN